MTVDLRPDASVRSGAALRPSRERLANGVTVIAKHSAKTPAVTISLALTAGSIHDPSGADGAMHLLARTIDRGTVTRSADQIGEALDDRGVTLNVSVTRHQFFLTCTCLAADFEAILPVLADVVQNPSIPETELATRKGEVITAIRQDDDSPLVRASESLLELLYEDGHPYGRRLKGSIASVQGVTRDQLLVLHQRTFGPAVLNLVVVGDVEVERALHAAAGAFSAWERKTATEPLAPSVPPAGGRRRRDISMPGKSQSDVAYGFVAIARSDPDYYACSLMNNVLGQYAMGGRLGDNIRERQGMAYYVSSSLDANVLQGPLIVRAGVAPANVERTIKAIDEELDRLRGEGVTARELQESQQYLIGSMPRSLETNAGIASFLQSAEFFGLGLDFDERLPGLLRAVTLDQANAAARAAVDPARAAIVVAGPAPSAPAI
jgi:zinc protease